MNIQVVLGNRESIRDSFINQKEEVMFLMKTKQTILLQLWILKKKSHLSK